jgi:hypothetical protein
LPSERIKKRYFFKRRRKKFQNLKENQAKSHKIIASEMNRTLSSVKNYFYLKYIAQKDSFPDDSKTVEIPIEGLAHEIDANHEWNQEKLKLIDEMIKTLQN